MMTLDNTEREAPKQETDKLYAAMVAAQGEMPAAIKSREGQIQNRTYRYADIADVVKAIREPFKKNGLAYMQDVWTDQTLGCVCIQTKIIHSSGQFIESTVMQLSPSENTPQRIGSAVTYGKRYQLQAMVGVVAQDEDDDGAAAADPVSATKPKQRKTRAKKDEAETGEAEQKDGNGGGTAEKLRNQLLNEVGVWAKIPAENVEQRARAALRVLMLPSIGLKKEGDRATGAQVVAAIGFVKRQHDAGLSYVDTFRDIIEQEDNE